MEEQILKLLGRPDYVPSNVPELLRQLRWSPNRQQELQRVLRGLEQSGRITRTKGNRYIQSREADLIPGRIRMNKAGKGFLQPDDEDLKEIMIPGEATGTALHEDRVLVRRDVKAKGLRPGRVEQETGEVIRILERKRTQIVGTLQRGRETQRHCVDCNGEFISHLGIFRHQLSFSAELLQFGDDVTPIAAISLL